MQRSGVAEVERYGGSTLHRNGRGKR